MARSPFAENFRELIKCAALPGQLGLKLPKLGQSVARITLQLPTAYCLLPTAY